MALQTIPGGMWVPHREVLQGVPLFGTLTIDAATEKAAFVFRAPKTGTLDKFEFRAGAVTFGGSSVLRVSFQNVDASGDPDGTQDQFRDMTSLTANGWNEPGLITGDGSDTGTKRSVTVGDLLACVIEYQTFSVSDSVAVSSFALAGGSSQSGGDAYCDLFTASWVKTARYPACGLKYSDGSYAFAADCYPIKALNTVSFNSSSTPDERGLIFEFPYPVKLHGVYALLDVDAAADLVLYGADGSTVLKSQSYASGVRQANNGLPYCMQFAPVELVANANYRLVAKPTTTSDIRLFDFDVNAAAIMDAFEGGQNWHHTERTNGGAWTQTTTKRPWMGLLVSALDDATYPAVGDVRDGTSFNGTTGTLELPTEAQVESGVGFGEDGTEFTGELTSGGGIVLLRRR